MLKNLGLKLGINFGLKLESNKIETNTNKITFDNEKSILNSTKEYVEKMKILSTDENTIRSKFLYEVGFINLDRVKDYINTMLKTNVENINLIKKLISNDDIDVISKNMFIELKESFNLKEYSTSKFNHEIPNSAIDKLMKNYTYLKNKLLIYDLKYKYYKSDSFEKFYISKPNKCDYPRICQSDVRKIENKEECTMNSYYFEGEKNKLEVLYNEITNNGLIYLEKEDYYIIIADWCENEQNSINFTDFIKNIEND